MPELSSEAQRRIAKLKEAYRTSLSEKLERIEDCWKKLDCDAFDEINLKAFSSICHKLAGSAGLFGFDKISSTAQDLETLCKGIAKKTNENKNSIKSLVPTYQKLINFIQEQINS